MTTVDDIAAWMEQIAPLGLTEDWDNTGLLLGDGRAPCAKIQTCLTVTPSSVAEAIENRADLLIAHHPLPFRPVKRITSASIPGKMLWDLARHEIAVYSPHTAWDSARHGINARLAELLQLTAVQPLIPCTLPQFETLGSGRFGTLPEPCSLAQIARQLRQHLPDCRPRGVDSQKTLRSVAFACGSGGTFLDAAIKHRCDLLVTGEATFHTCLEAEAAQVSLLLVGHYASERFAMEHLASLLSADFEDVHCWASEKEQDPVQTL